MDFESQSRVFTPHVYSMATGPSDTFGPSVIPGPPVDVGPSVMFGPTVIIAPDDQPHLDDSIANASLPPSDGDMRFIEPSVHSPCQSNL